MIEFQEHVALAARTTLGLGGKARLYVECESVDRIQQAIRFAKNKGMRYHILGGGSNTIFLDEGFDGLVIKIATRGMQFIRDRDKVRMVVAAGEDWDQFVKVCVRYNLAGVECLSGIPGLVGATPIQNVGAYGQEVRETIDEVKVIDRSTLKELQLSNAKCKFAYRKSRFNTDDLDRFIVTEVTFNLTLNGEPVTRYPELQQFVDGNVRLADLAAGSQKLEAVRNAVLTLRRRKSMVVDPTDGNTKSAGSFFKNPVLTSAEFGALEEKCRLAGISGSIPTFVAGDAVKVPAAWLVERAGFAKGFRKGGVGISANHSLALVNHGGTTNELLALASEIQSAILVKFGVRIEQEPIVVR